MITTDHLTVRLAGPHSHGRTQDWAVRVDRFDSPAELTSHQPAVLSADASVAESDRVKAEGKRADRMRWYGLPTLDAVRQAVATGWAEGAAKVAGTQVDLTNSPTSVKRRRLWSDWGDQVDSDRVLSGDLERAWSRRTKRTTTAPARVTVFANVQCHAGVHAESVLWRGVAQLALSDALEAAGYAVRIIALNAVLGVDLENREGVSVQVTVKDYGQPLNVSALASLVALAGTKRHYIHRLQFPTTGQQNPGLGSPSDELLAWLVDAETERTGDLVITCPAKVDDQYSARRWLADTVALVNGQAGGY